MIIKVYLFEFFFVFHIIIIKIRRFAWPRNSTVLVLYNNIRNCIVMYCITVELSTNAYINTFCQLYLQESEQVLKGVAKNCGI